MNSQPTPQAPAPQADVPITRFQAQRKLGLFAPHDIVSALLAVLAGTGALHSLVVHHSAHRAILCLLAAIIVLLGWLVILAYRIGVFVLDAQADINLLPESSARIAVAYLQGRGKAPGS